MPEKTRVATIQSNRVPSCDGLQANPFNDGFSLDDLLESTERRIAWYENFFARTGAPPQRARGEPVSYHWNW